MKLRLQRFAFFKSGLGARSVSPASTRGDAAARKSFATLTSTKGQRVDPDSLLLAGSGKEAILASLAAIAPRGARVAVEALTYPFVLGAARLLGIELVPLQQDDEGVTPDSLEKAAMAGVACAYLQPTLQSPLVLTMTQARREAIANIASHHGLIVIEDNVYGFLRPSTPIAAYAPNQVIRIDSLSKRLMPGLAVGWVTAPAHLHDTIARSLQTGGWMAPSLAVELAKHWIDDGVVGSVEAAKKQEAAEMYKLARSAFADLEFRGASDALHGWLQLPKEWRAESFAAASAELGIAVCTRSVVRRGSRKRALRRAHRVLDA